MESGVSHVAFAGPGWIRRLVLLVFLLPLSAAASSIKVSDTIPAPPNINIEEEQGEAEILTGGITQEPMFMGGGVNTSFRRWVRRTLIYPAEAVTDHITGKVVMTFVVRRNGKMADIDVLETPSPILSDEVARVLALSPDWTPGNRNGRPARVKYILPIIFIIVENP